MPLEFRLMGAAALGLVLSLVLGRIDFGWFGWLLGILPIIAGGWVLASLRIIPENQRWVIERLGWARTMAGKPRVKGPGLVIVLLLIDRVHDRHFISEQMSVVHSDPLTKDSVKAIINSVVFWKIGEIPGMSLEEACYLASYAILDFGKFTTPEQAVVNLNEATIRSKIGTMTFDDAKDEQESIDQHVVAVMGPQTRRWGITTISHQIKDIDPEPEIQIELRKQITADLDAKALRIKATGEADAKRTTADADLYKAKQDAEALKVRQTQDAEGEGSRLERLSKAVGADGALGIHLTEEHTKSMIEAGKNGNMIIIGGDTPMFNLAAMLKSGQGILEAARRPLGKKTPEPQKDKKGGPPTQP